MQDGILLAAIDIGSNSFRLEIGRFDHGQIHKTEYLKETVRLGNGLDETRNLTAEAMQRGLDCLARFAERLKGFQKAQVRAVATQTLREARNRNEFLLRAGKVLGFPIDVISGREEARLIYLGVAHLLPQDDDRRLVVDIGGRSTELILGRQFDAGSMESYRVGSVAWSMRYFAEGRLTQAAFDRAAVAAKAVLDESLVAFGPENWDMAYGSSGTIGAVSDILKAGGQAPDGAVTRDGLAWLVDSLVSAGHADQVRLDGLKEDRKPVIGGGLSVLLALFDLLGIQAMEPAQGALRQGVLFDMLDRDQGMADVRSASVQRLAQKFAVDPAQAARVGKAAAALMRQLNGRNPADDPGRNERQLQWAANLHELGSHISHSDYHKHGGYVLDNADALGFAQAELQSLGLLVRGHKGKVHKLDADFDDPGFIQQLLCLRLAVILCHARRDPDVRALRLRNSGRSFTLLLDPDWSRKYPQSAYLLQQETAAWQKTAWLLQVA